MPEDDEDHLIAGSYALTAEGLKKDKRTRDYAENLNYARRKRDQIFADAYTAKGERKKAARKLLEMLRDLLPK